MSGISPFEAVPCGLADALRARGFERLTAVQQAVLAPEAQGRDLRICSQTGSGKTVAIGLALAPALEAASSARGGKARPVALIVAPTRELAQQLGQELGWLLASLRPRIAVLTGGTSLRGDFQDLGRSPQVIIGTPGRLVDHLERGSIELGELGHLVLDEADEMLDMGFRDELQVILDGCPEQRRTHLVSATFSREILRLAARYQTDALSVATSDSANTDIEHVAHPVAQFDRFPALVNVLLASHGAAALVFVRTRITTTELAAELGAKGFAARALSGEMSQNDRNATLEAFRSGQVNVLVATDVAARGLDVPHVDLVVHFDLPVDAAGLTHRSGRTGRAGRKGTSVALVPPPARARATRMYQTAGIEPRWKQVPSPESIAASADERLREEIVQRIASDATAPDAMQLAALLLEGQDPAALVAALLARIDHRGPCAPLEVAEPRDTGRPAARSAHGPRANSRPKRSGAGRAQGNFTPFQVSWGSRAGADPGRLLAVVCRRGGVKGQDIGAIRIGENSSMVEVASHRADAFARAAQKPDTMSPRVGIRPWIDHPRQRA